ncbi:MAG TPA: folate hydrolase, partial [Rhodanobacteraceae bacterium]|nr:folate hydrolase [Rhodanobacteraceae bacterium]
MKQLTLQRLAVAVACLTLTVVAGAVPPPAPAPVGSGMLGFTSSGAAAQKDLEQRFDALLNASDMRAWLQHLSAEPNQVGSPHDKANAEWLLAQFKSWGWDAHIETFDVLYPTPTH